jgi:hypothetical protein
VKSKQVCGRGYECLQFEKANTAAEDVVERLQKLKDLYLVCECETPLKKVVRARDARHHRRSNERYGRKS